MTTAIFIQDGAVQLVLTPENEWERNALKMLGEGEKRLAIMTGSFYETRGGWNRFAQSWGNAYGGAQDDRSLIIRVLPEPPVPANVQEGE